MFPEKAATVMNFSFTTTGESHGPALVATVEGLPAGLSISRDYINHELWRRQQGYGRGGRMKIERDRVQVKTGLRHGATIGSPLTLEIPNLDFPNWAADRMAVWEPQGPVEPITLPRPVTNRTICAPPLIRSMIPSVSFGFV